MITATGLQKRFRALTAVHDLSFDVGDGEIFGILGPNGAGKTTTVRMLSGLIAPSDGTATINGLELGPDSQRIRAITGMDAYERFREAEVLVDGLSSGLRTSRTDLQGTVSRLQDELKKARREADELRLKLASGASGASANGDESREVAGIKVLAREASGLGRNRIA